MPDIKKKFKPGEVIIRENTPGNNAYIIQSGKVEVSKNFGNQRVVFTILDKGSIFGEMCLVDNMPRSATVTALEETTVTILSQVNFKQSLKQNPAVETIFKVITNRLRETDIMVNPLRSTNFYFSLCSLIYYLSRAEGSKLEGKLHLDYDFVLRECCMILAMEKDLVEKVMNRMVFTKLIRLDKEQKPDRERRILVIPNPELFKQFIDFLQDQSVIGDKEAVQESRLLSDKTYKVLKVLVENVEDYKPETGKSSVSYDKYLSAVEDLLNIPKEKTDKLLKPLIKSELFRITIDSANNISQLVCNNPKKLIDVLSKQTSLRTFEKMVNLLKSLAAN